MKGAKMRGTILTRANLFSASTSNADLRETQLRNATSETQACMAQSFAEPVCAT
jgi:uncharacterized protein YjbI with pentapeptide repeats